MKSTIGEAIIPLLKDFIEILRPIIQGVIDWVKENPKLTQSIMLLGPALVAVGSALLGVATAMAIFQAAAGPIGWIALAISLS